MADSSYVYESGDPITVGLTGETDYLIHSGEQISNTGQSTFVFESGVGLGGLGGLVHRYPFNDGGQDTVGGADLGVNGSVTFDRAGKDDDAADFPGTTGDYLRNTHSYDFPEWTVSIWVYSDAYDPTNQVWEFNESTSGDGSETETHLEYQSSGMKILYSDSSGPEIIGSSSSGTWEFWVGTYDGSTGILYKNDASTVGTVATTSGAIANVAGLSVGRDFEKNIQPWNGGIDDFRIYNRALSASEVSTLYNSY